MRVLIASCIRQKPEILAEFLESLDALVKPENYEYFFVLNELEEESEKNLSAWSKEKPVETEKMSFGDDYITDEDTHHWNSKLVSNVIKMKNRILEKATDYDYLLFVDSDIYLHPKTLTQLLSREKDIITEISWTQWYADDNRALPNAWFYQKYGFPLDGLERLRNEPLLKVGGFGGLYLITKKALEAGVSFTRVEGKPNDWGEDRHFAVRAQELGFDLWCDTTMPSFHIYRMSDLSRLQKWKDNRFLTPTILTQHSSLMKGEWNQRASTRPYHYISDFRESWDEKDFYECGEIQTRAIIDSFLAKLKIDPSDLVLLEIGCGLGRMTRALASRFKFVHAYDVSDQYIRMAKKKNSDLKNVAFHVNDGLSFPEIDDESVDFCFSGWTMQHMPSEEVITKNIEEVSRVLKEGGLYKIDPVLEYGPYVIDSIKPSTKTSKKESVAAPYDNLKATSTYAWGATSTLKKMASILSNNDLTLNTLMEDDGTEELVEELVGRNVRKRWLWGRKGRNPPFKVLDCRWGTRSELEKPEFVEIVNELDAIKTVFPRWSRCWEYPYAYLSSNLEDRHRVLDAGCGDSPFKFLLESHGGEVHGIDKTQIELPENSNVVFKQCDIAKIDYPAAFFDRVFCISVLEHTQQPPMKYIKEMLRVLKVGATLHLTLDFNRWMTQWKFKKPEILKLCRELGIDYPPESTDLLKSEDHPEGKTVGEGLSVLGFTILKTGKTERMQKERGAPTVLISVPHTGNIKTELVSYLLNVVARNALNGAIRISVDLSWGMPVDSNRNSIAKKFLETKNEWLLTIDSDNEPPDRTLEELLSHGKKVVGAVCWSSMGGEKGGLWEKYGLPYPVVMKKNPEGGWNVDRAAFLSRERLIEVDSASTACVLIHRDVFEALDPPYFRLLYDEDGVCNAGEDFTFFEKVRRVGFLVFVDTSLQCGHYKTTDIRGVNQLLAEMERVKRNGLRP